ncbi:hypothetical protein BDP81DRAFT_454518 [Colletotrichum phormii]|uniref:Uncharacterized protein n=1 Tax=Colletotrichum phormii TaxID=359342 RepID=A0AAI9ZH01_9PEZI|nr:uncharacterized protein BDP81DRAFT_454518 [Colletotrichum phormii]KAK1623410.1 hypothetical protein BDP81DRAFT_454518 [Colletotrichum phormii]
MRSAASSPGHSNGVGTIAYFSPASSCPDQYTTAGVAAKNAEGAISSSGLFVPPFVRVPFRSGHMSDRLVANPLVNVFMEALDRNETAVVCCPNGYTVGFNGDCFSQVPESVYGPTTTACLRNIDPKAVSWVNATFTCNNTAVSGLVYSYVATSYEVTTKTRTFTSVLSDSLLPVASKPAMTMIYNAAVETGTGGTGGGGTAAATGTGAPSAAHGVRMTTSGGNLGILVTVWAFAALAGVALAMPL